VLACLQTGAVVGDGISGGGVFGGDDEHVGSVRSQESFTTTTQHISIQRLVKNKASKCHRKIIESAHYHYNKEMGSIVRRLFPEAASPCCSRRCWASRQLRGWVVRRGWLVEVYPSVCEGSDEKKKKKKTVLRNLHDLHLHFYDCAKTGKK
jgi:hypothetical protein